MSGVALSLLTLGLGALAGCHFFHSGVEDPNAGEPLTEFSAKNGQYFPPFICKFFPGATQYGKEFPTLEQARADVSLIELKQLNSDNLKFNEANLSWSADGVYLGYEVLVDGFRKIMLKDLAGDFSRELEVVPQGASNFLDGMVVKSAQSYNAGLRWSRDSTRFAFMSNGGIGEYNIYVGAIGIKEKAINSSHSKDGYATWSPTTNEIAFVSSRSGNGDIYVIDLKTKELSRLSTSDAVDIFPDWFPDGNHLVYSSGDALVHDLELVERDERDAAWNKPYALTRWNHDSLRPTVSPDGRFIAFYALADGDQISGDSRRWDIVVVPYVKGKTYTDAELRQMVIAKDIVIDLNTGPAWSPDSRKVFFVKRDPAVFNPIYAYDLFTGRNYMFKTKTRMNRDILMSKLGILSFRAQVGVWDRVFVGLTNQGLQLQSAEHASSKIHYMAM